MHWSMYYVWEHIFSLCSRNAFWILIKLWWITHIVYNITSPLLASVVEPKPPMRGVHFKGFILLIRWKNCLKYNVECFEKNFGLQPEGVEHSLDTPTSAIIHSLNIFLFNNIAHLLVHSAQVSDIRPFEPLVLFVKNILRLCKVNMMGLLETSHHNLYDLNVLNSTYR